MNWRTLVSALAVALAAACVDFELEDDSDLVKPEPGKEDSSAEAVFLDFEFDGELLTTSAYNPAGRIEDQLLYTVGHLNGDRSLGRLDKLELTDIQTAQEGDKTLIRYRAKMPVAWADRSGVPESYTFRLPRDMSYQAVSAFTEKYMHSCVSFGAHDVDAGSMWYYYRPDAYGCALAEEDIITVEVGVSPSSLSTTGKFPEYHKVWEDGVFKAVAILGKYEAGATSNDAGISAYNQLVATVRQNLSEHSPAVTPPDVPEVPGVEYPDISVVADLPEGKRVEIALLLVDGVRAAGPEFDQRYEELSADADFIAYSGHSGLGANIRALARKGRWVAGQYVVVFMNGCDTYAYVDSSLADAHAAVNADDPIGTKYVDIVTNAMPASPHTSPRNIWAFIGGLLSHEAPKTYEQMFAGVDSAQVVLVSGEEDNVYVPGYPNGGGGGVENWEGMSASGEVARSAEDRFETPKLAPGRYLFEMTGTSDADLYVRIGEAPTAELYDCRPYRAGSRESCAVELPTAAAIHVMVRGWADSSEYELTGARE